MAALGVAVLLSLTWNRGELAQAEQPDSLVGLRVKNFTHFDPQRCSEPSGLSENTLTKAC